MESSRLLREQATREEKRKQIARRLLRSQPAGFRTLLITLLILQSVAFLLSGIVSELSSRRSLRGQWSDDSLFAEAQAATAILHDDGDRQQSQPYHAPLVETILADPIDNYYSRKHMTIEQLSTPPPILFVGGSDGSGTRAFVETLRSLGVPMLVDDDLGCDVHAGALFNGEGWPPLVRATLGATGTANYEYDNLPPSVKHIANTEVQKFKRRIGHRGNVLLQSMQNKTLSVSSKVRYGLKAPVSMLVLPVLRQVFGPIKFIHVVRDGRDVAFSANQSPVEKFYDSFYNDSATRRQLYDNDYFKQVMAIELWNDWNTQTLQWEQNHNDGSTFDFLVMRSEDMLNPQTRYQSLLQLADFVGSPKSPQEICCFSRRGPHDMGSSVRGSVRDDNAEFPLATSRNMEEEHGDMRKDAFQPMDQALERRMKELEKLKDVAPQLYEQIHKMQVSQNQEMQTRRKERLLHKFGARHRIEDLLLHDANSPVTSNKEHRKLLETSEQSGVLSVGVTRRYGRWMDNVRGKPELNKLLHLKANEGLKRFGYEPRASFLDQSRAPEFSCDDRVVCF